MSASPSSSASWASRASLSDAGRAPAEVQVEPREREVETRVGRVRREREVAHVDRGIELAGSQVAGRGDRGQLAGGGRVAGGGGVLDGGRGRDRVERRRSGHRLGSARGPSAATRRAWRPRRVSSTGSTAHGAIGRAVPHPGRGRGPAPRGCRGPGQRLGDGRITGRRRLRQASDHRLDAAAPRDSASSRARRAASSASDGRPLAIERGREAVERIGGPGSVSAGDEDVGSTAQGVSSVGARSSAAS